MSASATPLPTPSGTDRLVQLELLALYGFAFVLPLFEAPKNLLWIAYVGLWVANHWRRRDPGGRLDVWDALILAWIVSGYVSAAFAGLHHKEWVSALDILRYASILFLVKRSNYDDIALRKVIACVVVGTLVALAWGYYGLRVTLERSALGLNSVGHQNHSAIFLAILFGATLGWVRANWASLGAGTRAAGIALILAFAYSLVVMQSRAAVGVGFVVAVLILGTYSLRHGRKMWVLLLAAVAVGAVLLAAKPDVVKRNAELIDKNLFLAYRDAVWHTGLKGWEKFPIFGVGIGNYSRISIEQIRQWSRDRGEALDIATLRPASHAHSLYVNTLVERGLVGLAALFAVLATWGWSLARNVPATGDSAMLWTYWSGACAAWLVSVLVGTVNTTLHHEHALLSTLLLGGWLCLRQRPTPLPETRA